MKYILTILLLATQLASAQSWIAYNPCQRTAAIPYQAPGDLVTVDFPGKKSKNALAFLTQVLPAPVNLTGQSMAYTLDLDMSPGAIFPDWPRDGRLYPISIRLWFSGDPNLHCFGTMTDENQGNYWWSTVNFDLNELALWGPTVLTETLTDPSKWSSALGKRGDTIPAQFFANVAAIRQIGLSVGNDNFYDLGARVNNGTATLHVR
jgi:hypothetical protein